MFRNRHWAIDKNMLKGGKPYVNGPEEKWSQKSHLKEVALIPRPLKAMLTELWTILEQSIKSIQCLSKLRALNNSHRENLQNQCFCNHWLLIKLIQNKFCLSLVVLPPPVLQLCHWRSDRTLHSTGHQTPQRKPGIQTAYFAQLTTKPIKNLSLPFATRTKPTS